VCKQAAQVPVIFEPPCILWLSLYDGSFINHFILCQHTFTPGKVPSQDETDANEKTELGCLCSVVLFNPGPILVNYLVLTIE
jgi:hypothetical protein